MLAVVIGVAVVATYYLTGAATEITITGTASVDKSDNTKVTFTPTKMIPDKTIASGAWEWAVYRGATKIGGALGAVALEEGTPVTLTCDGEVRSGDVVKIKYKGTWVDAATI